MKHKTWFRLVLKATGVLLIGLSLPRVVDLVILLVEAVLHASEPERPDFDELLRETLRRLAKV